MNFSDLLDAGALLSGFGNWALAGIALIIFIESGVLFPFLPGDSMLVTAAILRHDLGLSAWLIIVVAIVAAFLGDQVGFWLGHTFGRRLFKDDARILKTAYLQRAELFFRTHGPLALVLGRFVPIVRTYIPVAAGAARMPYKNFIGWNISGAVLWVVSMTMVGVLLGDIPGIADRIDLIAIVVVAVSVLPVVISAIKNWRAPKDPVDPVNIIDKQVPR